MSQSKLVGAPKGRRRRNEKKQNILECARYLIGTKLERFSIDVIVRKYKISNGTFYHYFSDRSEMMKELYILSSM